MIEAALKDGAPKIWDECPTGNVVFPIMMGNKEATDAAFAKAAHKVTLRMVNNRLSANSMETRGYIGDYSAAEDFYTLYTATQNPHGARSTLAGQVFHVPESQMRVIAKDVGGGFGMKGDVYPEEALVLWASKKLGRPVKWISSRSEGLLNDTHGRDQIVTGEIALDKDGNILGLRAHSLTNLGGNVSGAGVIPSLSALQMAPQSIASRSCIFTGQAVFTNTTPIGPYRGAGRPEATYFIERMIEHAALATGIDRVEIRRRNFIPSSAMPFTTATGVTYDSGDFADTMTKTIANGDWDGYAARKAASEKHGKLRGRGLIYYVETCGDLQRPHGIALRPERLGDHCRRHLQSTARATRPPSRRWSSDWLGVPFETSASSRATPRRSRSGSGTYGSRTSAVGGGALKVAADTLIEKAKQLAEPSDGSLARRHPVRGRSLHHRRHRQVDGAGRCRQGGLRADDAAAGLRRSGWRRAARPTACRTSPTAAISARSRSIPTPAWSQIDRYTVVDDVGMVINPLIVEGQIVGGIAQGFGQALLEEHRV